LTVKPLATKLPSYAA